MGFAYYGLKVPEQWRAGYSGLDETKPFYFDCADCGAKEAVIAGYMASQDNPTFTGIAILNWDQIGFVKLALFCSGCFAKRLENEHVESSGV